MSKSESPPRCNIADLKAGQRVDDEIYRVAQKDLRTTSNGSLYIHAVLADGTGQVLARMWNAAQEIYDSMPAGGLLHFRGRVEMYKGNRQFIIDGVRAVEPGSADPTDFLPATRNDVDVLWNEVKEILRTIENSDVLALVGKFVNDDEFVKGFKRAPAAVQLHHAYLGGLIEHTWNLLRLAQVVCPLYPKVSRDLLLAGIFLHDAGKVRELAYETNLEYTNEGQLLGHIVQCVLWVHEKCRQIEQETGQPFPAEIETTLKHLILAHHGKYEFGSPRLPAMAEAFVMHYLDNLDAKVAMCFDAIESDPDASSAWTSYVRAIETRVFKPDVMGIRGEGA
ncbi:MAG: HD domain-containing protein [Phycisphaerae bacterium]|nr:HD domain-containing protein [Phycisphaerae bacterium]